jgi:formate-dependent nitrite reductase membrane component NrfD
MKMLKSVFRLKELLIINVLIVINLLLTLRYGHGETREINGWRMIDMFCDYLCSLVILAGVFYGLFLGFLMGVSYEKEIRHKKRSVRK